MYHFIRPIWIAASLILLGWIFLKARMKTGRRTLIAGAAVLVCLLSLCLVETLFVTFPSAEEAYKYSYNSTDVELVVQGSECDLIVDINEAEGNHRLHFVPKTTKGWKTSILSGVEYVVDLFYQDGAAISVIKYRFSEDYFVCVDMIRQGEAVVFDSCGSEFFMVSMEKAGYENGQLSYYARIADISSPYWVEVNGKRIDVIAE